MKRAVLYALALSGLVLFSCERKDIPQIEDQDVVPAASSSQIIKGRFIVLYKDEGLLKSASIGASVTPEAVMQTTRDIFGGAGIVMREPDFIYSSAIRGIAVGMTDREASELAAAPGVRGVWPDMVITIGLPERTRPSFGTVTVQPAQIIPSGIKRVGGPVAGVTGKAWIIDTGIDLDHPDLNVDPELGKSFIPKVKSPDDDHGHGTHCAGIVGAIDNEIGVIGVAPGVTLVPVKVIDSNGSGPYSVVIKGVDYVARYATAGDAANLSLGGPAYQPLDDAVISLGVKGIKVAVAACNNSADANGYSPARANGTNVYTVSAMDNLGNWASFSNYGNPPVDFCAPGVSVYSTYPGGGYSYKSGTSMATPHVCGLLLAGAVNVDGTVTGDPDGNPDPIAHH